MHSNSINKKEDNNKSIKKIKRKKIRLAGPVRKDKPIRNFHLLPEIQKQKFLDQRKIYYTFNLYDSDSDSSESSTSIEGAVLV